MRYKKTLSVALFVLMGVSSSWAQQSNQQQYLNAKGLFKEEKFELSMEAFKPLMEKSESNPFDEYASFYYAISAYKAGYVPMAKNMFLQIKQYYPKWSKLDEVNYWLGNIYFESEEDNQALNVLKMIKNKSLQADVTNLKFHYLSNIQNVDQLKQLYANNPNDKVLGEVLAKKIAIQPLVNQDQELLDKLVKNFDLDEKGFNIVKVDKSEFKDSYKVAVMFPFLVNRLDPTPKPKINQLVLDMYDGIRMAQVQLAAEGIQLEIYAYDTKRSKDATAKILEKKELEGMDVIIGPLFAEPRELVQNFSFKHKINMINPLSTDSEVIGNNPYSFLYKPSSETLGRKVADYVIAKNAPVKTGIIFYGESKNDSTLAYAFKERIEKANYQILAFREIKKNNSREILDVLVAEGRIKDATGSDARSSFEIPRGSLGHIFVASDDDLISSKVISGVETRSDSVMILGAAEWLDLPVINFDAYQRLDISLYANLFIQKEGDKYKTFRDAYLRKHKILPTDYAAIGYDLTTFLGKSLKNHGKYFQLGWDKEPFMEGELTVGYSYDHSQDNGVVPIIIFNEEGIEVEYEIENQHENREK